MGDALRYLQTIVEQGTMTRAASALYISQPALSRYISRLESSIGVTLVDRSAQPLVLTPEGHRYSDYLQASQRLWSTLEADLKGMGQLSGETVRLGATAWRTLTLIPQALQQVLELWPGLRVDLYGLSNSDLLAGVRSKKLDLAMMYTGQPGVGVHFDKVADERVLLVGRSVESLLIGRDTGTSIPPAQLRNFLQSERLILMHQEHNLGAVTRDFLTKLGVNPRRVLNINNVAPMIELSASGTGVTFAPESMIMRTEYAEVPYIRIQHMDLVQEIGLAWPADKKPNGPTRDLADILHRAILESSNKFIEKHSTLEDKPANHNYSIGD